MMRRHVYEPMIEGYYGLRTEAGNTFVNESHGGGIMVALAPPKHVVQSLTQEGGEPHDDLHVTLAYLGKTGEYDPQQLKDLPGHVAAWAQRHDAPDMLISGSGTFLRPDEDSPHVLHALVNSPRLHRMQAHLVDRLKANGYNPREDHGFVPHITLGYTKHDVRFLPKVQRQSWKADQAWSVVGDERRSHPFRG
jgi:2'-5' RNA ligase